MLSSYTSNGNFKIKKKLFTKKLTHLNFQLPDKSIASLVKFYYSWKKARTRSSTERHEKKKHHGGDNGGGSENGSENGSPNDSDVEEKVS